MTKVADQQLEQIVSSAQLAERVLQLATSSGEAPAELAELRFVPSEVDPLVREARRGRIPARALEIASNRAKVVLMAADSWIVEAMLRHAALGADSPYDGAMLRFLAKSRGLAKPSRPVDDVQREADDKRAIELAELPTPKVIEGVLARVRNHATANPDEDADRG